LSCEDIKNQIPEYLEGELPQKDLSEFESHIGRCVECSGELELFRKTWNSLDVFEDLEPSPGFAKVVMDKISSEQRQEKISFIEVILSLFKFKIPAWAAVILVFMGSFLTTVWNPTVGNGDNQNNGELYKVQQTRTQDDSTSIVALSDVPRILIPRSAELLNDELGDLAIDNGFPAREWGDSSTFDRIDVEELFNM
jgi:hypothetical protein